MERPATTIAVWDSGLRQAIEPCILPGLNEKGRVIGHGLLADSNFNADPLNEHQRLERILATTALMIVCVSGIAASEVWAIRAAFQFRCKIGLIVRMEDQWKWQALPGLQAGACYDFVVSMRGPNKRLSGMFPHSRTLHVDGLIKNDARKVLELV